MLIIPAIDLKDGKVVRFVQGKKNKKVYSDKPLKIALDWQNQGAKLLHIVDLDGAISGEPKHLFLVKEIVKNINIPIEFGGGARTYSIIKDILDLGIKRVVLGTKALEDKKFLNKLFKKFKEKIIISLDVNKGKIMLKGWRISLERDPIKIIEELKEIGFKEIIYTDTQRDGTLQGPNILYIEELLKKINMKIIISGGISSLVDIQNLKRLEKYGLYGIIVGKALYERRFSLREAIEIAS